MKSKHALSMGRLFVIRQGSRSFKARLTALLRSSRVPYMLIAAACSLAPLSLAVTVSGDEYGAVISGAETVVKSDAGTTRVTGNNTYTGETSISDGVLEAGHINALGKTSKVVFSGGKLLLGLDANNDGIDYVFDGTRFTAESSTDATSITIDLASGSSVTFKNSVISGSGKRGGAILSTTPSSSSSITIGGGSLFENNSVTGPVSGVGYGGAISSSSPHSLSFSDCSSNIILGEGVVFKGNFILDYTTGNGGAIESTSYSYSSSLSSPSVSESNIIIGEDATFEGNYISGKNTSAYSGYKGYGGAIYSYSQSSLAYTLNTEPSPPPVSSISSITIGKGVKFEGNYITGTSNTTNFGYGGAIYSYSEAESYSYSNATPSTYSSESRIIIGDEALFKGNYVEHGGNGGAISSNSKANTSSTASSYIVSSVSDITIGDGAVLEGNHIASSSSLGSGGVIYSNSNASNPTAGADVSSISNVALGNDAVVKGNYLAVAGNGGVISSYSVISSSNSSIALATSSISVGDRAVFEGNYISYTYTTEVGSTSQGGVFYSRTNSYSSAISSYTIGKGSLFKDNYISIASPGKNGALGGVIYSDAASTMSSSEWSLSIITLGEGAVFENNYASGSSAGAGTGLGLGGAIYSSSYWKNAIYLTNASFRGNHATTAGGAIYVTSKSGSDTPSEILAINGGLTEFSGNKVGGTLHRTVENKIGSVEGGTRNAIHINGAHQFEIAADSTSQVLFEDAITTEVGTLAEININQISDKNSDGTINTGVSPTIMGGLVTFKGADNISTLTAMTTVYGGTFEISDGASYGQNEVDTTFVLQSGASLMTSGDNVINTIAAESITLNDLSVIKGSGLNTLCLEGKVDLLGASYAPTLINEDKSTLLDLTGANVDSGSLLKVKTTGSSGSYNIIELANTSWMGAELSDHFQVEGTGSRQSAVLSLVDDRYIHLSYVSQNKVITWTNNNGGEWDITSTHWADNVMDEQFNNGDAVIFNANTSGAIVVNDDIDLVGMVVTGGEYTFSGNGSINGYVSDGSAPGAVAGDGRLAVMGGEVVINTSTNFTGIDVFYGAALSIISHNSDMVNEGTISLNQDHTVFSGNVTNNGLIDFVNLGRTLTLGGLDGNGSYRLDVNLETGEADRLIVNGDARGRHRLILSDVGSGETVVDRIDGIVTVNGETDGVSTFTGTLQAGVSVYTIMSEEGKVWDLVATTAALFNPQLAPAAQAAVNLIGAQTFGWQVQNSNLHKRMGDLRLGGSRVNEASSSSSIRTGKGTPQVSPQTYAGNFWVNAYGAQANIDMDVSRVSKARSYVYGTDIGGDFCGYQDSEQSVSLGAFLGYQWMKHDFKDGFGSDGDTEGMTGGIYGTWLHKNGWYADLVIKAQQFENEINALGRSDSYDNIGFGGSVEIGKQIINEQTGWFLDPSVQVTWLHLFGEDYTAGNHLSMRNGSADIWNFSAMVRAGRNYKLMNDSILQPYIKLGVEEKLSSGGRVTANDWSARGEVDGTRFLGGGGLIWQINNTSQIHLDYELGYGGKYDTPWNVNLGYRMSF